MANEAGSATLVRSSQASTLRLAHSRENSSRSTLNGFLTVHSGGETSSGAVSPIDGPVGKYGAVRRLSSLPENRNSNVQTSDAIRGSKRLLFSLFQLHGPMGEVARALKDGTPKRSTLDRQLFTANAHVEELERLLNRLDGTLENDSNGEEHALRMVVLASVSAMKSYGVVVKELRHHTLKAVTLTDPSYIRCLMSQIYMSVVEARNICMILGFKIKTAAPRNTPRVSRAWSSRTVTPTQAKPINNKRLRGATILQELSGNGTLRSIPSTVSLHGNGSRTNTLTSMSAVTPRLGESFTISALPSPRTSRSNTMRSVIDEKDEDNFDRIYDKLSDACSIAAQSLPHCRAEFAARKTNADQAGQTRAAHHWAVAINKCDSVIGANNVLLSRLKIVRVRDPVVRNQRDFWQLCDTFVQSWTDLATELKNIMQMRIDITAEKAVMRSVQKAVKEVSKTISESPLYQQVARPGVPATPGGFNPHIISNPFPPNINTAFAQAMVQGNGMQSGYVTPVPATPLSAALGPAVQATVVNLPPLEYFQQYSMHPAPLQIAGRAAGHERTDTVMQPPGYPRR